MIIADKCHWPCIVPSSIKYLCSDVVLASTMRYKVHALYAAFYNVASACSTVLVSEITAIVKAKTLRDGEFPLHRLAQSIFVPTSLNDIFDIFIKVFTQSVRCCHTHLVVIKTSPNASGLLLFHTYIGIIVFLRTLPSSIPTLLNASNNLQM